MAATVAKTMAERSTGTKDVLLALAHAVAANETAQRRFRNAVLIRLSTIETTVKMIHGAQIAESHGSKPGFEEKIHRYAEEADEYISKRSHDLGLKMIEYIYGEPLQPGP